MIKLAFNIILPIVNKRTQSDKVLTDKVFKIVIPDYDGYERGLASMLYKFFDGKSIGNSVNFLPNQ